MADAFGLQTSSRIRIEREFCGCCLMRTALVLNMVKDIAGIDTSSILG
jgi:hypothetical protein